MLNLVISCISGISGISDISDIFGISGDQSQINPLFKTNILRGEPFL